MLKRISSIMLVAMLLIGMAAIFQPTVKAVPPWEIYIDPAATVIDTDFYHVGDTFAVNVSVKEVILMFAYEFKLRFNNDTLQLMSATRPAGNFLEPVTPGNDFQAIWKLMVIPGPSATVQDGHFSYTLLAPEAGKTGGGVLVTLTFKILVEPPWMGQILNSFDLWSTVLVNTSAEAVPHTATDGTYEYNYLPPAFTQYLSVKPTTTVKGAGAPIVGTLNAFFDVFVDVNALNYNHWCVAIEFKLSYDPTLIDYVGIAVDPWLDAFGTIYLVPVVEGPGSIHTAVLLLPHSYPPSVWNNPIDGTGHLVKVTFEVIYEEAFPWQDSSPLDLYDSKFVDKLANQLNQPVDNQDGLVIVKGFIIGRQLDMYTQYPGPYGGQGPNSPSDMFWPQKQVELYANVTYNLWPVQNKIVAFEIHNAAGEIVTILTAVSDEFGVAHTSYRIPWPCFNTSALFGIWTVVATVDIACIVVNDTMQFHFDYLIDWVKVTTDKDYYAHGETIHVTVDYQTYAIQHYNVLFTCVVNDELNYPIGKQFISVTVGDLDMMLWCTYAPGTIEFDIPIPKYAAAGIATLHINALSDFPWFGGSAWCEELTTTINILAL
jgi:hypothetical protein